MRIKQGLFITGTGTDVGKSLVTAALSRALWQEHTPHIPIKPVQTGVQSSADADATLYTAAHEGLPCWQNHKQPELFKGKTLFSYAVAASPHLAAKQQGKSLRVADILQALHEKKYEDPLLLEGAGGLYVPLNADESMLDVIQALALPVVLVMQNTLGALNHTLLSLETLRQRRCEVTALICKEVNVPQNAQEELIRADNVAYLEAYVRDSGTSLYEMPYVEELNEEGWDMLANSMRSLARRYAATWRTSHLRGAKTGTQTTMQADTQMDVLAWDKEHLWHPYTSATQPLPVYEVTHAKGTRLYLRDGTELMDGMSSWWCAVHGYGQESLVQAAQEQAARMSHVMFGGITHGPAVRAAQKLMALLPQDSSLSRLFWADSGSVAVEVALKMALQYQQGVGQCQRTKILSPRGGYYGDTLGAMSVCDPVNGMHTLFTHVLPQHIFVERPACAFDASGQNIFDAKTLRPLEDAFTIHGQELAAVILEPVVQGAGGMYFYDPRYLQRVRELCDAHGVLLICDEIATGFGRTGKMFAHEWCADFGKAVTPDIMCVGKALTGGMMTLGATLCTEKVAQGICQDGQVFMHGPTFMANPLACAVAEASLDIFADGAWREQVLRMEAELKAGLEPCAEHEAVQNVRVLGAIGVVEMRQPVDMAKLQAFFVQEGVWIRPFGKLIYVMPPYVSSTEDVAALCKAVCAAVMKSLSF